MSTFTAYFCGTGSHRFDTSHPSYWNGELVSTLASHDLGREFAQWVAVDGPGSGNMQDDNLFVEPGGYFKWNGALFGKGWEENVSHVLQVIKGETNWSRIKLSEAEYNKLKAAGVDVSASATGGSWFWQTYDYGDRVPTPQQLQEQIIATFRKPRVPTQVNLVGWSRGGISCHMLANAMAKDPLLKQVPVNIFVIDPVPGVGNMQSQRVQLASNVREYVGFYSRDERSKGFACVIPSIERGTSMSIFPMPGRHATLVGNASLEGVGAGKQLIEPGLVVRHFAEVCLKRWGVNLDKCLNLSEAQVTAYHRTIAEQDERYVAMRSKSYTFLTEGDRNDRFVQHGLRESIFSMCRGEHLYPSDGLSLLNIDAKVYRVLR